MDVIVSMLIRGIFQLIRFIPVRLAGAIGAGLGRMAFYLDGRHRDIAVRNLARIYPGRNRNWRQRIARESFAELGRSMLEIPHVFLRSAKFLRSRIRIEDDDALRNALNDGKGAFVAACHHSNWELGALMFSMLGYKAEYIYRPLRQASLDAYLKQMRERFGARLHPRQNSLRWLLAALKRNACIGFMIDQHIRDGLPVPFMGHLANTLSLPAEMAARSDTPVFGAALLRDGRDFRFRWRVWRIAAPETADKGELSTCQFMSNINRGFEDIIHERPELWLWTHRRWKLLEEDNREMTEVVHGTP